MFSEEKQIEQLEKKSKHVHSSMEVTHEGESAT